jgi:DNA invertase Pin-like site-specific DNA recombinase
VRPAGLSARVRRWPRARLWRNHGPTPAPHRALDLMLAVLGGLADVERDLIRTRTAEGRSRAKAQGQQMGRPPALHSRQRPPAAARRALRSTNSPTATTSAYHHSPCDESRLV